MSNVSRRRPVLLGVRTCSRPCGECLILCGNRERIVYAVIYVCPLQELQAEVHAACKVLTLLCVTQRLSRMIVCDTVCLRGASGFCLWQTPVPLVEHACLVCCCPLQRLEAEVHAACRGRQPRLALR
jgi:hypothetical protein